MSDIKKWLRSPPPYPKDDIQSMVYLHKLKEAADLIYQIEADKQSLILRLNTFEELHNRTQRQRDELAAALIKICSEVDVYSLDCSAGRR